MNSTNFTARVQRGCLLLLITFCAHAQASSETGGDPLRGKAAIGRYGCVACHTIPGVPNPGSAFGPPLAHVASRSYIGGVLPNTPADMVRWLRNPPAVDPRTAMPDMDISPGDAKDIAAYLYTLK
jgi:cytochrome c